MTVQDTSNRYEFGKNWKRYVELHFSDEKVEISRQHMLSFLGRSDLSDMRMLDIGSGSGLHSLAAWRSGVREIVSFDYDSNSVATTRLLHDKVGNPSNWTIRQGSVLNKDFMKSLGTFDFVYSWGVLHHTGSQWNAIRNAMDVVSDDGIFYVALYDSDAHVNPGPKYWLSQKEKYSKANCIKKFLMEIQYSKDAHCGGNFWNMRRLPAIMNEYKKSRGMDLYTDVKDWLGGWPMEFTRVSEVLDVICKENGFNLLSLETGGANTEYVFSRGLRAPEHDLAKKFKIPFNMADIDLSCPIALWGMGVFGEKLLDLLLQRGARVSALVDKKRTGDLYGIQIMTPEEFLAGSNRNLSVVTTSLYFTQILRQVYLEGFFDVYHAYPMMVDEYRKSQKIE